MWNEQATVEVAEVSSPDLTIRGTAKEFCQGIESLKAHAIRVDFSSIKSITKSFAQEYLRYKKESKKDIEETNIPSNVRKMFIVIEHPRPKRKMIDLDNLPVTHLSGTYNGGPQVPYILIWNHDETAFRPFKNRFGYPDTMSIRDRQWK
jgi:hypothetical protein